MKRARLRLLILLAGLGAFLFIVMLLYHAGMARLEGKPRSLLESLEWMGATFTTTGSASFTDQGLDYSGHFTAWGNFNLNEQNANSTFTFNIFLNRSDGARINGHEVDHITYNGNGDITVTFGKIHLDGC